MSTKTKRNRKYLAHDEKSKFFIFLPEMVHGSSENVMGFYLEMFSENRKKS